MKPIETIGLMSGTSLDGVDAVAVRFEGDRMTVLGHSSVPYSERLRNELLAISSPGENELERAGVLSVELARIYAAAVERLLSEHNLERERFAALGVHGQTVRHRPELGFSVQLNAPAHLAEATGIDVVADLRSRDLAAGGEGAPLVPAFHKALFTGGSSRVILNLGGIANISVLPARGAGGVVAGGDTGPANMLMDIAARRLFHVPYDRNGEIARRGHVDGEWLSRALEEPYFARPIPKSTGRELFNEDWLERLGGLGALEPHDLMRTLAELTAVTASEAAKKAAPDARELFVCGGGALNPVVMEALGEHFEGHVGTTDELGLPPMLVEACAFAWLAKAFLTREPGNLPSATNARGPRVLGCLYPAR